MLKSNVFNWFHRPIVLCYEFFTIHISTICLSVKDTCYLRVCLAEKATAEEENIKYITLGSTGEHVPV